MKFSLRLNNDLPTDHFVRIAALAEESGFDQIWVSNDLFWRSAPVLVAAASRATSSIALGVGVFNPVSMHASEIAMAAASLQEASDGRFRLGIGAGADRFLAWAGLKPDPPAARTRKAISELRHLFAGDAPSGWQSGGILRTGPVEVPIYVGAMGPRMLELAGEVADGALPLLFPPEHYSEAMQSIAIGARRARREAADLDVAACIWCSIDADPIKARHAMAQKIAYYGPSFSRHLLERASISAVDFEPIELAISQGLSERAADLVTAAMIRLGVSGSAEMVTARCAGLVAMGANHISFGPPLGPDVEQAVRVLGRDVAPALRNQQVRRSPPRPDLP
jgi:5,10-methylenetetrahydromethanopterin reductase